MHLLGLFLPGPRDIVTEILMSTGFSNHSMHRVVQRPVAFIGTFVDAPTYGNLRIRKNCVMVIGVSGRIARIAAGEEEAMNLEQFQIEASCVMRLEVGCSCVVLSTLAGLCRPNRSEAHVYRAASLLVMYWFRVGFRVYGLCSRCTMVLNRSPS